MAELMLINPRKRRRKTKARVKRSSKKRAKRSFRRKSAGKPIVLRRKSLYMTNPRKRSRKYKRNPIGGFKPVSFAKDTLMPSAIGAAGALGLDMMLGFLPLPAAMKTPAMRPLVRIAGAIGIGMLAGIITNKRIGEQVGAGAMTVVLYDTLKGFVQTQFPAISLAGMSDYPTMEYLSADPSVDGSIEDMSDVGEYVEGLNAYVSEDF